MGSLAYTNVTFLYDYCFLPIWNQAVQACVNSPYVSAPAQRLCLVQSCFALWVV